MKDKINQSKSLLIIIILIISWGTSFANSVKDSTATVIIFRNHIPAESENKGKPNFYTNIPELLYWETSKGTVVTLSQPNDTLRIYTEDPIILFRNRYNVLSYCDFVFFSGDTILINYKDGFPFPEVKNRKSKEYDFKVDYEIRQRLVPGKFDPIGLYERAFVFGKGKDIEEFKNDLSEKITAFLNDQSDLLDSLFDLKEISDIVYGFHKDRIKWLKYTNELEQGSLSKSNAMKLIEERETPLFPDRYFNEFVDQYVNKYIYNPLASKDLIKGYNQILNEDIFDTHLRDRLLGKVSRMIIARSSKAEAINHYERMKNDINNPVLISRIYDQYATKLANETSGYDLYHFEDMKSVKFDDLIKENPYSYIDFWASWCKPCIQEMEYSKKIATEFSDKKIGFIYLSIDENKDAWNRQVLKIGMDKNKSFIVSDFSKSKILKELNIREIPRYVIVNDKGEIIYRNALRPSNPELKEVLDLLVQ